MCSTNADSFLLNSSFHGALLRCLEERTKTLDVSIGNEHRLAGDDPEDMGNELSRKVCKVAVEEPIATNEEDEMGKCASNGVFIDLKNNVSCVVYQKGGENKGRKAKVWIDCHGAVCIYFYMKIFVVIFWHGEEWTARNEALIHAVLQQTVVERSPWLIACDAILEPRQFCEGYLCK